MVMRWRLDSTQKMSRLLDTWGYRPEICISFVVVPTISTAYEARNSSSTHTTPLMHLPALPLTLRTTVLLPLASRTNQQILAIRPFAPRTALRHLQHLSQCQDLRPKFNALVMRVLHTCIHSVQLLCVVENKLLSHTRAPNNLTKPHRRGKGMLRRYFGDQVLEGA
jgi:hypothetical protein